MRILSGALPVALAAAVGNALFVLAQRRGAASAAGAGAAATVVAIAALVCATGLAIAHVLAGRAPPDRATVAWGVAGGVGLLVTFLGFQVLFARYGAGAYTLYAVVAILTTSIGVGVVLGGEPVNRWHLASAACAIAAIVLYGLGRGR